MESHGIKSYLSAAEKKDLVQFVASTGENYQRYLEYCEQRGWRPFTQKYLHTWIQRRREKVQIARQEHREEVRKTSMYDKERRVSDLETMADQLKKSITKFGDDPKMLISLSEQLGKTLERIAKERGEWLKAEAELTKDVSVRDRLKQGFDAMLAEAKEAKIIDGAARVVG
jgi:hypothetical protein